MTTNTNTPSWKELKNRIHALALERGELSGLPIPVEGIPLRTADEKSTLNGYAIEGERAFERTNFKCSDEALDMTFVNEWWCRKRSVQVIVCKSQTTGKSRALYDPFPHWAKRWQFVFETMTAGQQAWDLDPELEAVQLLQELTTDAQFSSYMMTGTFIETSLRSGVGYFFRRCRPTIALLRNEGGGLSPRTALCLHPLAYYENTYAGGMVPTDDIIAHLMLMRGDEHRFWKKSNQHPLDRVEAGL